MNANPAPRHGFTVGLDALAAHCEEQQARHEEEQAQREEAARERAAYRPRPIDTGLLGHEIPDHVDALIGQSAWADGREDGADRDQKPLYCRLYLVALSLTVRGWTCEEFLAEMPDYTPSVRFKYRRDEWGVRPGQNILWWELCERRGRPRDPAPMVVRAFKKAAEKVGRGYLLDVDQPAYVRALTERWRVAGGAVRLTRGEAAVLGHVMDQMRSLGRLDVACPARAVATATGLTPMGAWKVLQGLASRGILVCRSRGVGDKQKGRAAIYCLSPQLEQAFVPAPSKPPSPWGALRAPGRGSAGTTKKPERAPRIGDSPTVRPGKPQVKALFGEVQRQTEFTYQGTTSFLPSCTSRGPLIGKPAPHLYPGLAVLAEVVSRREQFLAELESLMGKPEPQPDNTPSTPDMTPELMRAILRNLPKDSKFFRDEPAPQPPRRPRAGPAGAATAIRTPSWGGGGVPAAARQGRRR
jgi:hypothetical protein